MYINGLFKKLIVTASSGLKRLAARVGINIEIVQNITISEPIDITGYTGIMDFRNKRITYTGAEGTNIITGVPLSGFVINFWNVAFVSSVANVALNNISGDGTQIVRFNGLRYINTIGAKLGSIGNIETLQFKNATIKDLIDGLTIGSIKNVNVDGVLSNTKIDNFDEKNLLHVNGFIGKISVNNISYEKLETVVGAKSDNEHFMKIDNDTYIDSGSVKNVTSGLTQMSLINPDGLHQEELQNVNFDNSLSSRNSSNYLSTIGGGGVLNNHLQSSKYLLNGGVDYTFDTNATIKEGIHLSIPCGCIVFEKDLLKTNRVSVSVTATGSTFEAEISLALLECSKHFRPVFVDYITNEIIINTNLYAVDEEIYFLTGDAVGDKLPTGIVEKTSYFIKTINTTTRRMTISATQGGAEIDYSNDAVGNALVTKIEKKVTFDNTDNTVALTAHGYSEGQEIHIYELAGAVVPAGIVEADIFRSFLYVRNPTTDKFQVSYTPTSAVLTFTDDGSGIFFLRKIKSIVSDEIALTPAPKTISVPNTFDVRNGNSVEFFASNIGDGIKNITVVNARLEVS